MKRPFYILGQILWGFPQTLAGFVVFLLHAECPHKVFFGSVCTSWRRKASLSLGLFIFVSDDPFFYYREQETRYTYDEFFAMTAVHEYGHTIQSLIWGPLYLPAVGVPSMIWAKLPVFEKKRAGGSVSYYDVYPEKQANRLGERATGLPSPGRM